MKRLVIPILSSCILACCVSASLAKIPAIPMPWLDGYIRTTMQDWKVPGLAIAVVKDNDIVLIKAFGVREVGKPTPRTDPQNSNHSEC